jgi:ABC-type Fe3+/spermidine/putrescine transport system ATPase subunit
MALLEVRDLRFRYSAVESGHDRASSAWTVDIARLDVDAGEQVLLTGSSGRGKSTLLNLIAGIIDPVEGSVTLDGVGVHSLRGAARDRFRGRTIGMIFQTFNLLVGFTAEENVMAALMFSGVPRGEHRERARGLLKRLGMVKYDSLAESLSVGQQQRVAVARALAIRPVLMLLDEALSALDKNLREEMQIELALLMRNAGITAILVTHDQREAFTFGDRIAVMNKGVIHQIGTPEEVYRRPATSFVLDFLGSVSSFPARLERGADGALVAVSPDGIACPTQAPGLPGEAVRIYLRSDDISLSPGPTEVHRAAPGKVALVTFLGSARRHVVNLGPLQVLADLPANGASFAPGEAAYLSFAPDHAYVLPEGGK